MRHQGKIAYGEIIIQQEQQACAAKASSSLICSLFFHSHLRMKEDGEARRGEKTFIEGGAMRAMCHSILQGIPELIEVLATENIWAKPPSIQETASFSGDRHQLILHISLLSPNLTPISIGRWEWDWNECSVKNTCVPPYLAPSG